MVVGYAKISLLFSQSSSLKSKRRLLKSIIDKLKNRYNISIAEVADQNLWQKATICIAYVGLTGFQAKKTLKEIENFIEKTGKGRMSDYSLDIIKSD